MSAFERVFEELANPKRIFRRQGASGQIENFVWLDPSQIHRPPEEDLVQIAYEVAAAPDRVIPNPLDVVENEVAETLLARLESSQDEAVAETELEQSSQPVSVAVSAFILSCSDLCCCIVAPL